MKAAVLVMAALQLQAVLGGHFSVRMPFVNPAGVTYVEGPAPAGLAAGPLAYSAPAAHGVYAHAQYAAPVAPVAYAAVPTVQHVPAVQDVPYTRIEATHGFVQKELDVAKPAVATRRFQIRRPAIQKQFYDIEERVVVRPAGSALLELEQPLSKTQKGATLVSAAAPLAYAAHAKVLTPALPAYPAYPALSAAPIVAAPVQTLYPQQLQEQQQDQQEAQQQQQDEQQQQQQLQQQQLQDEQQQQQQQQQLLQDEQQQQQQLQQQQQFEQAQQQDDTVEVSNPDLAVRTAPQQPAAPAGSAGPAPQARAIPTPDDLLRQFAASPALKQLQAEGQALEAQRQQLQARMAQLVQQQRLQQQDAELLAARQRHLEQAHATQPAAARSGPFTEARFGPSPAPRGPAPRGPARPAPVVETRSLGSPLESLIPAPRSIGEVVPSVRNLSPEQSQQNQQRLIQLLTAQGGVAEVGSARSGGPSAPVDAGQVHARVLSATPAPEHAEPTNERVQTRRVVVSSPIETVQEIDVVEPFTKIHRVAVHQPAVFKTAVQDVARVHTSVPVYGKALAPALAPYSVYHH